jgi:phage tail protein X
LAGKIVAREGEHWDEIAKRALGAERYMTEMLWANPDYMHYAQLPGGVEMTVPEVAADNAPASLPPWKRMTEDR